MFLGCKERLGELYVAHQLQVEDHRSNILIQYNIFNMRETTKAHLKYALW